MQARTDIPRSAAADSGQGNACATSAGPGSAQGRAKAMPDADHVVPTHQVTRQRHALLLLTTVLAVVMHWLYATAAGRPAGPMSNGALAYAMNLRIATAMLSAPSGDRHLRRRFGVSTAIKNSIGSRERGGAGCRSQMSVADSGVADMISQHSKQVGTSCTACVKSVPIRPSSH
jgi:hypothetical protein